MVIAVVGAKGKLGSEIVHAIKDAGHTVVGIDKNDNIKVYDMTNIDVCIDASSPSVTKDIAKTCKTYAVPLLVATTGHSQRDLNKIKAISKTIPIEFCPNLSFGIMLIKDFLTNMQTLDNVEASIYEQHHKDKLDTPSGTALFLADVLKSRNCAPVEITSSRFGSTLGVHKITLNLGDEIIQISHTVLARKAFAKGAFQKALDLKNRQVSPDVMPDIIGENYDKN